MTKPNVLELHGTELSKLTPSSIVAAALRDLALRAGKKVGTVDYFEPYAFHRRHVQKADSAEALLSIAMRKLEVGQVSGKRSTRLLYANKEALLEARVSIHAGADHGTGRQQAEG